MPKLEVNISGVDYLFELDRKEIKRGEILGFDRTKMESQMMNQMQLLWTIGLHKNQPNLSLKKCDDLFEEYAKENGDIAEVIQFLGEQYQSFLLATQSNSSEMKKGKIIE